MALIPIREALRAAMREEMQRDPSVFLMGEEVAQYDGAYKVSQGMLAEFGPDRIVDTPISECGFAGLGIGAAMVGMRPIIEFMTWNFSLVAYDQIVNSAAKIYQMSGGQYKVPIVFRGPNGAAENLASQHSTSVESLYAHFPGLKVVTYATAYDAKGLLKSAIRDDSPVCFLESEMTYGMKGEVPDEEYLIPIGKADIKALFNSVAKTGRCVVVQEGYPFSGVGAEIVAQLQEHCFDLLDAPVLRITNRDVPQPYATNLEKLVMPSAERVVTAARRVLGLER